MEVEKVVEREGAREDYLGHWSAQELASVARRETFLRNRRTDSEGGCQRRGVDKWVGSVGKRAKGRGVDIMGITVDSEQSHTQGCCDWFQRRSHPGDTKAGPSAIPQLVL